ncbi:MAG: hypothetical protein JXA74_01965 [Anaerolineae bacterium]|nr:hypothetical protein [Anaerolineae bacterium]
MQERRNAVVWGAILIAVGILALLSSLGFRWLQMESLWPFVLVVGGLLALVNATTRDPRNTDGVWFGLVSMLCGAFFLYITLGAGEWRDLSWMWPVFPVIAALAWATTWLFDVRQVSNLVAGVLAGVVGVGGFLYTLDRMDAGFLNSLSPYWPLILVLLGLGFIVQFLLQRR